MKIGIAGDWHANTRFAVNAIARIARHLEPPRIILHAGDFGVWRGHGDYLRAVSAALDQAGADLWFVDGNHEDHPYLRELGYSGMWAGNMIAPHITHLERGTRWEWHGKTWLALGGAVSVDKNYRTEGDDWFADEEISDAQETEVTAAGQADVLLSHDAPARVTLHLGVPPAGFLPMIPHAEQHRERLQRICRTVKPRWIFHGHYHLHRQATQDLGWGPCTITSLDMDGTRGNWGILDTETMRWEW